MVKETMAFLPFFCAQFAARSRFGMWLRMAARINPFGRPPSGYDSGQPDIPYLKPAPLKDVPRPVLRQFKDGGWRAWVSPSAIARVEGIVGRRQLPGATNALEAAK